MKELFLHKRREGSGWFVKDAQGWTKEFCLTRWGARRAARRILRAVLKEREAPEKVTLD